MIANACQMRKCYYLPLRRKSFTSPEHSLLDLRAGRGRRFDICSEQSKSDSHSRNGRAAYPPYRQARYERRVPWRACVRKANCGAVSALLGLIRLGCEERAARRRACAHLSDPRGRGIQRRSVLGPRQREFWLKEEAKNGRTAELVRLSSTT
ncbi:hypothetical protein F4803DRAFT_362595 [Xylaria telfairii]|nr:hypothetical protein F4803DRAFT_362595 [Xylaria telfairii]